MYDVSQSDFYLWEFYGMKKMMMSLLCVIQKYKIRLKYNECWNSTEVLIIFYCNHFFLKYPISNPLKVSFFCSLDLLVS